jgi:hypothetical protein
MKKTNPETVDVYLVRGKRVAKVTAFTRRSLAELSASGEGEPGYVVSDAAIVAVRRHWTGERTVLRDATGNEYPSYYRFCKTARESKRAEIAYARDELKRANRDVAIAEKELAKARALLVRRG